MDWFVIGYSWFYNGREEQKATNFRCQGGFAQFIRVDVGSRGRAVIAAA